jgi:hypothetical protein
VIFVSDLTNSQQKAATVTITYFSNPQTLSTFSFDIDGFHPFNDATCPKTLQPPADCIG